MDKPERTLALVFGDASGNHITFALDELRDGFIKGAIGARIDGEWTYLTDRDGIEPLALRNLRDDMRQLVARGGALYFGDHDYALLVHIKASEGVYTGALELPSIDVWDVPLASVTRSNLNRIVGVVDEAEVRFGPLTQHCACGRPEPTWASMES